MLYSVVIRATLVGFPRGAAQFRPDINNKTLFPVLSSVQSTDLMHNVATPRSRQYINPVSKSGYHSSPAYSPRLTNLAVYYRILDEDVWMHYFLQCDLTAVCCHRAVTSLTRGGHNNHCLLLCLLLAKWYRLRSFNSGSEYFPINGEDILNLATVLSEGDIKFILAGCLVCAGLPGRVGPAGRPVQPSGEDYPLSTTEKCKVSQKRRVRVM